MLWWASGQDTYDATVMIQILEQNRNCLFGLHNISFQHRHRNVRMCRSHIAGRAMFPSLFHESPTRKIYPVSRDLVRFMDVAGPALVFAPRTKSSSSSFFRLFGGRICVTVSLFSNIVQPCQRLID